jgi:hypothetical protein
MVNSQHLRCDPASGQSWALASIAMEFLWGPGLEILYCRGNEPQADTLE